MVLHSSLGVSRAVRPKNDGKLELPPGMKRRRERRDQAIRRSFEIDAKSKGRTATFIGCSSIQATNLECTIYDDQFDCKHVMCPIKK